MAGPSGAVCLDRLRIGGCRPLGDREVEWGAGVSQDVEERPIGGLSAAREVPCKAVEHDRGAALADGKGIAPEP